MRLRLAENAVRRSERAYVAPTAIATHYALAGEKDLALKWLEKGYEERLSQMVFLQVHPQWDILRSDPRFQDLVRRMNFPNPTAQ